MLPMPTSGAANDFVPGLVSIITPAYNAVAVLAEAVASVQAQTYTYWEMIIAEDCSSDNTLQLARHLAESDGRIRVLARAQNGGAAAAKNDAIRAARGQFIAYLDSDDLWLPHKLKTQLEFLNRTGAGFCFSSYQPFNSSGKQLLPVIAPATLTYRELLLRNVIGNLTVLIDRAQHPVIPTPTIDYEDFVSWLTLLRDGTVARAVPEVLALYRVSANSVSSKKARSARWVWRIYRESERLSLFRSAAYLGRFAASLVRQRYISPHFQREALRGVEALRATVHQGTTPSPRDV